MLQTECIMKGFFPDAHGSFLHGIAFFLMMPGYTAEFISILCLMVNAVPVAEVKRIVFIHQKIRFQDADAFDLPDVLRNMHCFKVCHCRKLTAKQFQGFRKHKHMQ